MADEVVVVDTGSRDATAEIARAHGARVLDVPWTGDFAAARNAGLDAVRGRWVLYIDADERLRPIARAEVERLLGAGDDGPLAYRVGLRPTPSSTPYREYRLWRSDPAIRFRGVIHEKIHPAIMEVADARGRAIADAPLELVHLGYEGDQEAKHRRNLPLLETQLAAEPDSIFNWRHLGEVRLGLGDLAGAREAFERAVQLARTAAAPDLHGAVAYGSLADLLGGLGEPVAGLLAEGRARYPEDWMLVWLDARVAVVSGRCEEGLAACDRLLAVDVGALHGAISYDERIFGTLAHEVRGLALFRLGRYAEAAHAYAEAERGDPGALELTVKRRLAEARAGQAADRDPQ